MYKTILIPTDGSEISMKAVRAGSELAKSTGAKVIGLFVMPEPVPGGIWDLWTPEGDEKARAFKERFEENLKCLADAYLSKIKEICDELGVNCEVLFLKNISPAEGILKIAEEKNCDLIVMASHGMGGVRGFIGSVTLRVLSKGNKPVLVCR